MSTAASPILDRRRFAGLDFAGPEALALAPHRLEIQPTANCHRTCSFCSHIVRNGRGGELSPATVDQILLDARDMGVRHISLSGGGEPLIWTGQLARAVAAASAFAEVTLTTSGDQLWDDEREGLSELAQDLLPHVGSFLLNTPGISDASLKKQIRNGPDWERVSRLLSALVAERERRDHRYALLCVVVVTRQNIDELQMIDRSLHELGIDRVYFKEFKIFGGEGRRRPRLAADDEAIARARAAEGDAQVSQGLRRFLVSRAQPPGPNVRCWAVALGFSGAIVDPRGDLYVCTPTVGVTDYRVGNVRVERLPALWRGEARRAAVAALSERSRTGGCPRDCRFHPHNQLMESSAQGAAGPGAFTNAGMDDLLV